MYHVHVNSFPVCDGTELRHNRGGGEASKYKIQRVPKIKFKNLNVLNLEKKKKKSIS